MHTHVFVRIIHGIVLPMYNVHPYFSLKNLGKESTNYTGQNTVSPAKCTEILNAKIKKYMFIFPEILLLALNIGRFYMEGVH